MGSKLRGGRDAQSESSAGSEDGGGDVGWFRPAHLRHRLPPSPQRPHPPQPQRGLGFSELLTVGDT
eukprot:289885-Rhodomonas_salina.1